MRIEDFDWPTTRKVLLLALSEMAKEPKLFSFKINERTLTQRLAFHLQLIAGRELSVDCEYNRMWVGGKDLQKQLPWSREVIWNDDDEARTVYPDILVHVRGVEGAAGNALVIEAKRNHTTKSVSENDRLKLEGFTALDGLFKYSRGAFVNFRAPSKRIEVKWFEGGKQQDESDEVAIP
jgi:hypothetical protein